METEAAKLAAVEARLRDAIRLIVKNRMASKEPLSWRVMFDIENEAISLLERDANLDVRYLNMMASPSAQRRLRPESAAASTDVADAYATHTALAMIQEAYHHQSH
ncbi:hypothetical protein GCM10027343_39630 [Noviherbaspirillum agri]